MRLCTLDRSPFSWVNGSISTMKSAWHLERPQARLLGDLLQLRADQIPELRLVRVTAENLPGKSMFGTTTANTYEREEFPYTKACSISSLPLSNVVAGAPTATNSALGKLEDVVAASDPLDAVGAPLLDDVPRQEEALLVEEGGGGLRAVEVAGRRPLGLDTELATWVGLVGP